MTVNAPMPTGFSYTPLQNTLTVEELLAVPPVEKTYGTHYRCNSIILVPTGELHSDGYAAFVLVISRGNKLNILKGTHHDNISVNNPFDWLGSMMSDCHVKLDMLPVSKCVQVACMPNNEIAVKDSELSGIDIAIVVKR